MPLYKVQSLNTERHGHVIRYRFAVEDQRKSPEFVWLNVDITDWLTRMLELEVTTEQFQLAATAVEYHLRGKVPAECYRSDIDITTIIVSTDWFPEDDDGNPILMEYFQEFEVIVLHDPQGQFDEGDYNLLPHQEELLRHLANVYREGNGKYPPSFRVISDRGRGTIKWEGQPTIAYDESTLLDDLQQLASEGLLDLNPNTQSYRITRKSLVVVAENFRKQDVLHGASQTISTTPNLDLSFIKDTSLRTLIERDYAELRRVISVDAHKSMIVLSGSIAESLLLERLLASEKQAIAKIEELNIARKKKAITEWYLDDLIKIAIALLILPDDAEALANQLKDYRNMIHPGVETRKAFEPTPARASAAVSLLYLIVEALA